MFSYIECVGLCMLFLTNKFMIHISGLAAVAALSDFKIHLLSFSLFLLFPLIILFLLLSIYHNM